MDKPVKYLCHSDHTTRVHVCSMYFLGRFETEDLGVPGQETLNINQIALLANRAQ